MIPFNYRFIESIDDFSTIRSLTLICEIKNFVIRKSVYLVGIFPTQQLEDWNRSLAEFQLKRWLFTHVFYHSEANKIIKILLWFKPMKTEVGARFKVLFNKTYIYELLRR